MTVCDGCNSPLVAGEAVRAFYHMGDHPLGYRYVRLTESPARSPEIINMIQTDDAHTALSTKATSLVFGLSTGWIPATVHEGYDPDGGKDDVLVMLHGHFADAYHPDPEPVNGMFWRVQRRLIRSMGGGAQPTLELSLFVVRWWDYHKPEAPSRSHNVLHQGLLYDTLEASGSPHQAFGKQGNYEVYSAFVRGTTDLPSLTTMPLTSMLQGRRRAALYFLWPTQRPAHEQRYCGTVGERELLHLMEHMETAGVSTCWPHPVTLYRQLAGKLWVSRLGVMAPNLGVPPTVEVKRAAWEADATAAAHGVLLELQKLRQEVYGGSARSVDEYHGVAKLGFSWQGEGVQPFVGVAGLVKALGCLLEGASVEAACLVQEKVEGVRCELRMICCRDLVNGPDAFAMEMVRMRLHPPRHRDEDETFQLTSCHTMSAADAAVEAFEGNMALLEAAEVQVRFLAEKWWRWFRDQHSCQPHVCRLDFLAAVSPGTAEGHVDVHTVEVTECGGSMCCLQVAARTAAVLNQCLLDVEGDQQWPPGFPMPLPPLQRQEGLPVRRLGSTGGRIPATETATVPYTARRRMDGRNSRVGKVVARMGSTKMPMLATTAQKVTAKSIQTALPPTIAMETKSKSAQHGQTRAVALILSALEPFRRLYNGSPRGWLLTFLVMVLCLRRTVLRGATWLRLNSWVAVGVSRLT